MSHIAAIGALLLSASAAWAQCMKEVAQDLFESATAFNARELGRALAADGDFAVAGAPATLANQAGAAYVFRRNGATWELDSILAAPASDLDAAISDRFGASVAIAGTTIVVGAPNHNGAASNAGTVYVFVRSISTGAWDFETQVFDSVATDNARFGSAVDLSGDTAVVGAVAGSSGSIQNAGVAIVFERDVPTTDAWGQVTRLSAGSLAGLGDEFGASVAINGDRIVVGARSFEDGSDPTNAGRVFVFERDFGGVPDSWGEAAQIVEAAAGSSYRFAILCRCQVHESQLVRPVTTRWQTMPVA
jgi:hypothetical protein